MLLEVQGDVGEEDLYPLSPGLTWPSVYIPEPTTLQLLNDVKPGVPAAGFFVRSAKTRGLNGLAMHSLSFV